MGSLLPLGWEALTQGEASQDAGEKALPPCCAGEGYPGIAHDLLTARRERDDAREALRAILKLSPNAQYAGANALSIARRALGEGER